MEELYTYYVNPWRPVKGLSIGVISTKKILKLCKEDVLKCVEQNAKIYRRFNANDEMIRITAENIDRYHTEKLLDDKDFKQLKIDQAAEGSKNVAVPAADPEPAKVEEPVVEEVKEEAPAEEPEVVEEPAPVVEEKVEEVAEEAPVEESLDSEAEEAVEEPVQEEAPAEEPKSDASTEDNSVDKVIIGFDGNNNKHNKKHRKNNNNQ